MSLHPSLDSWYLKELHHVDVLSCFYDLIPSIARSAWPDVDPARPSFSDV
jgi:hypothetical protein